MRPVDVFDHVVTVVHVFTWAHVQIAVQVHANVHVLLFQVHAMAHELVLFHVFVRFVQVFVRFAHDKYLSAFSNVILLSPDAR